MAMNEQKEALHELFNQIRVAMVLHHYDDVARLMAGRTQVIDEWIATVPSEADGVEIATQTLQLHAEFVRLAAQLKDSLRRSIEMVPARKAYGSSSIFFGPTHAHNLMRRE